MIYSSNSVRKLSSSMSVFKRHRIPCQKKAQGGALGTLSAHRHLAVLPNPMLSLPVLVVEHLSVAAHVHLNWTGFAI